MDSWRSLAPGQLAGLARALGALRWSWSIAEVDAVLANLGWTVAAGPTDAGVIARTGFAPSDGLAEIGFDTDGRAVTDIRVPLTDAAGGGDRRAADFLRDAFAAAAQVLTGELGPPAQRRPGPRPEIRWAVASGVAQLLASSVVVSLSLLSTAYAQALDAERELDDDLAEDGT